MKLIFKKEIKAEAELAGLVKELFNELKRPSILLLEGELGAGKTTFVGYVCRFFNLQMSQSPTYAIHQKYKSPNVIIDHFDLYRLESEDEIESAGVHDLLHSASDYKIVEWPQRIQLQDYPQSQKLFVLKIELMPDQRREFSLFGLN